MDAGNYNDNGRTPPGYSVLERWYFGMNEGTELTKGRHTLRPISENGDYYYLKTDNDREIFLFECRRARGWDAHIGGNGLLVYHVDYSDRSAGESTSAGRVLSAWDRWDLNELNARPEEQCADLIEPDSGAREKYQTAVRNKNYDAIYTLASHAFWPYDDNTIFTCDTDPAFRFWSGADSPLGLSDIQLNQDGSVSFTVFDDLAEKAPAVKIDRQTVFQDATIIQWSSVDPTYVKLRALFAELLAEIQRIKSEGDYAAGKALIETYAVNIDPVLHKEVKERYDALGLKPYGGFINPEIRPVEKDGAIVDYEIVYTDDYLGQMLEYGKKYGTL